MIASHALASHIIAKQLKLFSFITSILLTRNQWDDVANNEGTGMLRSVGHLPAWCGQVAGARARMNMSGAGARPSPKVAPPTPIGGSVRTPFRILDLRHNAGFSSSREFLANLEGRGNGLFEPRVIIANLRGRGSACFGWAIDLFLMVRECGRAVGATLVCLCAPVMLTVARVRDHSGSMTRCAA